ncbi:pentatricopeptide repeat-containing protein At2g13600-like [Magnolia sinica]|uniref:pentatricopeptide repeat-containing protein At2g13600-like n=1 Tax=Magnolia sinica TaxID=86752 RepID=UPI00265935C6|nr:pentatricopeptide repeat-containing protein At2g13600-like [Magnolia sinica]
MLSEAQKLHAFLLKSGLQNHVYRCNLLLRAYTRSDSLPDAYNLLSHMPRTNVVSYNTILSAYVGSGRIHDALQLFSAAPETDTFSWNIILSGLTRNHRPEEAMVHFARMARSTTASSRPDNYTYAILIPCCDRDSGRQLHAQVIKVCSISDAFIGTHLVRMYAEVGDMDDAWKAFVEMSNRDVASWNALISCYSKAGMGEFGLELFRMISGEGTLLDEYTFAIVLNEFASRSRVLEGTQVHSLVIRHGFCFDRFTCNALVNFYCKCGLVASAARIFDEIPEPDVVSWTALVAGLVQVGQEKNAMRVFDQMLFTDAKPNSFTFGGLLNACAYTNAFERGKQYHGLVLKFGLESDVVVGSAIVDMYSKCGEMDDASRLFHGMPERDLISWNGMICGFAQNGQVMKALKLFAEMVQSGGSSSLPNHITFIGVLNACGHGGLIHEGRQYFNDMIHKYMIEPKAEHYTCMVNILARAGRLEEAENFILTSPFEPDSVMWGTLLGACKRFGNLVMARRIAERPFVDEPENSSNYVLLANMYTVIGEWGNAFDVREVMDARGAQKMIGSSWIEIRNCVHSFVAGHKDHPQIHSIYEAVQHLCLQMEGY